MKHIRYTGLILSIALASPFRSYGYSDPLLDNYSEYTVNPIQRAYILFQRKIWRKMNLEHKYNLPFAMRGREITRVIIDGVKKGLLQPYENDTLTTPLSISSFMNNMIPSDGYGDENGVNDYFDISDMTILNIAEYVLFNKITAKKEYAIESITIVVPSYKNVPIKVDKPIATFKYKDLVAYFESLPVEKIRWAHPSNTAEVFTWMNAFDSRLFDASIIKIENTQDETVEGYFSSYPDENNNASLESQRLSHLFDLEFEHYLSEY